MAIIAECPLCHRKQSTRNKLCSCGRDLDKAKGSQRVKYHIVYWVNGKQKWEYVGSDPELNGYSIEDARKAHSKRIVQKAENRILDILPEAKMTFQELSDWYLNLKAVKKLASFNRVKFAFNNFNSVLGNRIIGTIKPMDLEDYQNSREEQGRAPATIDMEISLVKTMVTKAFDNDMVGGRTVKAFRKVKRRLKKGSNARKRIITIEEYIKLIDKAQSHLKPMITIAYNTGMRRGEIRQLKWSDIDREKMFIRLPAEITKEKRPKNIPINHHVKDVLDNLPRAIKHEFIFTYKGRPITHKDSLKRSFKSACNNSGITHGTKTLNGITFHDIRRSVKTNMLTAGVDKAHRDIILGHSLQGMDVHYLAPTEDSLKEAMGKYTDWLDRQFKEIKENQEGNNKESSNLNN